MSAVTADELRAASVPDSAPRVPEPSRTSRRLGNGLLALIGLMFALPMLWLLAASLDSSASWSVELPHFTLANFQAATASDKLHSLWNSFVLSGVATLVSTAASALAAYALSRRRIPWKGPMLLIVLFLSGVPMSILIVPVYQLFATAELAVDDSHRDLPRRHRDAVRDLADQELHGRDPL